MCLSMPAFLARFSFGHIALTSHFVLLLAIDFYYRSPRFTTRTVVCLYLALSLVTLLLHPYLFVMVAALAGAAALDLVRRQPRSALGILLALIAALALVYILGCFGNYKQGGEFGHFSMNMESPFFPSASAVFPGFGWSIPDATGGQYEGFNYLGAGTLLLLAVVLVRLLQFGQVGTERAGGADPRLYRTLVAGRLHNGLSGAVSDIED